MNGAAEGQPRRRRKGWLTLRPVATSLLALGALLGIHVPEPARWGLQIACTTLLLAWSAAPVWRRSWRRAPRLNARSLLMLAASSAWAMGLTVLVAVRLQPNIAAAAVASAGFIAAAAVAAAAVTLEGLEIWARRRSRAVAPPRPPAYTSSRRATRADLGWQVSPVNVAWLSLCGVGAALTAVVWGVAGEVPWPTAVLQGVAVLVASCPCGLGLATSLPLGFGVKRGAALDIWVQNSGALAKLMRVQVLLLDKTGTLTEGKPELIGIEVAPQWQEREALFFGASLEQSSLHPLGLAVVHAAQTRGIPLGKVSHFTAEPGRGVRGEVDGRLVTLGNTAFVSTASLDVGLLAERSAIAQTRGHSTMLLAVDSAPAALLVTRDAVKPGTLPAVAACNKAGIELMMLSGDSQETVQHVAARLGIKRCYAEMLPADKARTVRELRGQGLRVAVVGDGAAAAQALGEAYVGIAIGPETVAAADLSLPHGDLQGVVVSHALARGVRRIARQNRALLFVYHALAVPLATGALLPLWGLQLTTPWGCLAMVLSCVAMVGNALRIESMRL